jgi:cytochrome c biogenesis protein CcdA
MIERTYYFLFYYIYKSLKRSNSLNPIETAAMILALSISFNIGVITYTIDKLLKLNLLEKITSVYLLVIFISFMIINIIYINYKNRFKSILKLYQNKEEHYHKKSWKITLIYLIFSFLLALTTPFLINEYL